MGPTTIDGLPAHVLLVHFVVVGVPLTALALLLSVLWPAARTRLGMVTPLMALLTLILVPVTTHAGEWLRDRTTPTDILRRHADFGGQVIYWSAAVFVAALLWWLQHHPRIASRNTVATGRVAKAVLAGLAVAAALGSVYLIYRTGLSGAQSAWGRG